MRPAMPAATCSAEQGGRVSDAPRTAGDSARPPTPRELMHRARLRVLHGGRPYWVALLAAAGLSLVIVSGPVQTWLAQRDLVERREAVLAVLDEENAHLADRVRALNDPDTIEAEAREQQGMVRPGEVPYVIVPPDVDSERIAPDLTDVETDDRSWLAQVWEAISNLVD